MSPIVKIQDIEFTYPGQSKPTLKINNFEINKGESVFLFGPSGSGKSTLLEILTGILTAQKGEVQILGEDLLKLATHKRDKFRSKHMGYVFQSFNLIPYLNVKENIQLPLFLNRERKSDQQEFDRLVNGLGLTEFLDRPVTQLSVGQQQRVAVARALIGKPELILADEPTSSLDYDHRERFVQLLFQFCKEFGTTVLFVSHDRSLEKLFSKSISFCDLNEAMR